MFLGLAAAAGGAAARSPAPPAAIDVRVELDRPLLPAGSTETVVVKVALDGQRLPRAGRLPVNLALVIDKSGSMTGEKIARARQAALAAVDRLASDDVVALIVYDSEVMTLVPARPVGDGQALRSAIHRLGANGGTNLHGGVVAGAAELHRYLENNYLHRVILLSDGQANVGPSSPHELGLLGARLQSQGISVTTIGLGLDYNEDLMTRLARRSDGNTYFVADSAALPGIFQRELGDVLDVVARRLIVEVRFSDGVRPVRVVGRDGRVEGDRGIFELNQMYAGQEKFALFEVELTTGSHGGGCEIASASVRYDDRHGNTLTTTSARVRAEFTRHDRDVIAAANHRVQADYATNRFAETKDEVVELVDAGRRSEAAERLRLVADSLNKVASTYHNVAVAKVAAPAPAEAERVELEGLDSARRKTYRAEAQQTYHQQRSSEPSGSSSASD